MFSLPNNSYFLWSGPDHKFQIFLLGLPELVWQTQPFTLARRQARAMLYYLADDLQPVTRDRLSFLLWPDTPEATARRNLTRLLSYVRQALPQPDLLLANKTAVMLNPDLVGSDSVQFTSLCGVDNSTSWETAVSLYRSRFLDGFALPDSTEFDQWVSQTQRQYERTYLDVLRKLITAKSGRLDHPAAIQYAQQYLATDDLAEDIHRQLITLYAANGDRSAALRQYEQCAIVLERELGVPPLPETRSAYEAARDGTQPAPPERLPKPDWATLPGLDLPLIGRDEAWQALTEAYRRYQSGGVIFISGEAGVGKSRLMEEFATAHSGLVLTGNSHATGQALPYQPLVQALRLALPLHKRWRHTLPIWLAEVSRLLPELRAHFPDLPPLVEVAPQQAQDRLFEALTEVFGSLAAGSALLLCLDDVHWADEASLGWLQYVTPRLARSGICIVGTYRTHRAEMLADWRRALNRAGLAAPVRLESLSETAVAELLRQAGADQAGAIPLAGRIHVATGGNAFFVLETMHELLETGNFSDDSTDLPLPQTVRNAVLRRVARLTPLAQQVLAVAAVLSPHLGVETLVETSGRDELETANGLEEMVARQLLLVDSNEFRFQHDLARQAVYEDISPWRRRLLHRRAAEALERLYQTDLAAFYPSLAHHWMQVIEDGHRDPELVSKTIGYLQQAGEQAKQSYGNQEAVGYFRQALALLQAAPPDELQRNWRQETATELYESLGDVLEWIGQHDQARGAYQDALTQVPKRKLIWQSQLHRKMGKTWEIQRRDEAAQQAYRRAESLLGPEPAGPNSKWWQEWVQIQLEWMEAHYWQAQPDEMAKLAEKAQPAVEQHGTPTQRTAFFYRLAQMNFRRDRYTVSDETLGHVRAMHKAALKLDDLSQKSHAQFIIGFSYLWRGDLDEADKQLKASLATAEQSGDVTHQTRCLTYLTIIYRKHGLVEKTKGYISQALCMAETGQMLEYIGTAKANQAWLAWRQGNLLDVQNYGQAALELWQQMPSYPFQWTALWPLIGVAVTQDQTSEALEHVRTLMEPTQQQLPEALAEVMTKVLEDWKAGESNAVRTQLNEAMELAREYGYL